MADAEEELTAMVLLGGNAKAALDLEYDYWLIRKPTLSCF